MLFNSQERKISFGLLVMRIGLATVLLIRSAPKLFGGSAQWKSVGTSLSNLQFGMSLEVLGLVRQHADMAAVRSFHGLEVQACRLKLCRNIPGRTKSSGNTIRT